MVAESVVEERRVGKGKEGAGRQILLSKAGDCLTLLQTMKQSSRLQRFPVACTFRRQ